MRVAAKGGGALLGQPELLLMGESGFVVVMGDNVTAGSLGLLAIVVFPHCIMGRHLFIPNF